VMAWRTHALDRHLTREAARATEDANPKDA